MVYQKISVNRRTHLRKSASREAFTLIELLVVLGLIVIASVAGFISISKYKGGQDLRLTTDELAAVIRDVQKRSITQQDGKQWGIRFSNPTSTAHTYEVFSGASYSTSTVEQTYFLKRDIKFTNPGDGSSIDAIFSAISGELSGDTIISLITKRGGDLVGDIIIDLSGRITIRLEAGVLGYWHFD